MAGKKVLFVDDEKTIAVTLVQAFNSHGYNAFSCGDGEKALSMIAQERMRVFFLDLRMHGMDGMALCRQIKQFDPGARVFALSAYTDAYTPEQFSEAGFDGHFGKPFKLAELLDAAEKAFEMLDE
jgi:CheY-like chemotaxis protein